MAELVKEVYVPPRDWAGGGSGSGANSPFSIPGVNLQPVWCDCHLDFLVRIYDDLTVQIMLGGYVRKSFVYGHSFPWVWYISTEQFTLRSTGPQKPVPSAGRATEYLSGEYNRNYNPGLFEFAISPQPWVTVGKLTDFHWDQSSQENGNGTLWVCGTVYYSDITTQITAYSIPVTIPGISQGYFPFKIYKGGSWEDAVSCNRPGGHVVRINANNMFIDRMNYTGNFEMSTVRIHDGNWYNTIAPLVGKEQ